MFYEEPKMEVIILKVRNVFTIQSEEAGDQEQEGDWNS